MTKGSSPQKKRENYRTLSFLSCAWAEKIYLPTKHTKDAKISKTKIGWFVFPRHDQPFAAANAQTRRPADRRSLFGPWNIRAIRVIRGDLSALQRRE